MRALLDTQALLWYTQDDPRLPRRVNDWIRAAENERLLSVSSAWEIIIKAGKGSLKLDRPPSDFIETCIRDLALERLSITYEHVHRVADLPRHHGDPFDRILIAQSMVEGIPIVTGDAAFARYGVDVIWQ